MILHRTSIPGSRIRPGGSVPSPARSSVRALALLSVLCVTMATVTSLAVLSAAPAGAARVSSWGAVTELPSLGAGGNFFAVSCVSAGNCTGVGSDQSTPSQPFYATESNGRWGPATVITISGGGALGGVSCTAVGACTAVGSDATQPIVITETGGTWGPVTVVSSTGTGGLFSGVSCPSTGNCTAVGTAGIPRRTSPSTPRRPTGGGARRPRSAPSLRGASSTG